MLLDLWTLVILVSDVVEFLVYCFQNGLSHLTLPLIACSLAFLVIVYFAWRSTDIPELPSPPRPPYVITIQGNTSVRPGEYGASAQTLADVRLLSSGPYLESILRRYTPYPVQNSHQHSRIGNSERNRQQRSSGIAAVNGTNSNQEEEEPIPPGGFFSIFRRHTYRPTTLPLPLPIPTLPPRPLIRGRFNTPNLIVYHRVNVYHHTATSSQSDSNQPSVSQGLSADGGVTSRPLIATTSTPTSQSNITINPVVIPDTESPPTRIPSPSYYHHYHHHHPPNATIHDIRIEDIIRPVVQASHELVQDSVQVELQTTDEELSVAETEEETDGLEFDADGGVTIIEPNRVSESGRFRHSASTVPVSNTSSSTREIDPRSDMASANKSPSGDGTSASTSAPGGSTPEDAMEDVHFFIRFLNDTQIEVTSQLSERVADFKRRHFATEMAENRLVRLIFNGRVLDDDSKTLRDSGIFDHCVVHCVIVSRPQPQGTVPAQAGQTSNRGRGPDPGLFFVSIMGIILMFLWFICFHFGQQLFTQSAVVSLTVLTAIFLIGLVAFYLPIQPTNVN